MSPKVLEELMRMNPLRKNTVSWPTPEEIHGERQRLKSIFKNIGVEETKTTDQSWQQGSFEDDLTSLDISADDIVIATKSAKGNTSGGLQQITPWFL